MSELNLFKSDPLLIATLLAIAIDPMPYTLTDNEDHIQLRFRDDISPVRMFSMGMMAQELVKVVKGVSRDYRSRIIRIPGR